MTRTPAIAAIAALTLVASFTGTLSLFVAPAAAIPAFARKHALSCTACHTAPPRLNTFGERFLENGYQLPGTEDGGITAKLQFEGVSLDDVAHYTGVRLRGNAVRYNNFKRQDPPGAESGVAQNKTEFTFPETFSLFTAGTLAKNVGFFAELESNLGEHTTGIERAFLTFNNVGGDDFLHVRVGKFDPSATLSFSTLRQQLDTVQDSLNATTNAVQRAGLVPLAAAAKFYGLRDRSGTTLSPYTATLYNATAETGLEVRGRPVGQWFMYQIGILNGTQERFGDSNKGKDVYGAVRFDYARSAEFSASLSGFAYLGNRNAAVFDGTRTVDANWSRYGIAAHARYRMVDVYGMFTVDRISGGTVSTVPNFDRTASGLSIAADTYVTNHTVLSIRYDHMDAGGDLTQRASQTFLGWQVKEYLRGNIAVYARHDANLRQEQDGSTAAHNLRHALFAGIDVAY